MIPDNFPDQNDQGNEQNVEGGGYDEEPPRFDQAIPDDYYGDFVSLIFCFFSLFKCKMMK